MFAWTFWVSSSSGEVFGFCQMQGKGLPAFTVAPVGIGVVLVYLDPEGMRFEAYFPVEGHSTGEQYARFIAGL
jgi:hypothetical protein